ncbi:MAG: NAD-dependent 4,6-dehydratase LegB [Candidatus Devosia symbiotica]|nr:NAD-dependent 4,6-dehydratase LegB [Candidatus Devosia symbiotica]
MGKVLVTGADGFIGSHVVEALLAKGQDVRAFVQYNSFGTWGWLDSLIADQKAAFEVVAGDVRDANSVREAMRGCTAVIHLAALIAIPYSYQAPQSYIDTNINGTLNVLQAARDLGVERMVHTSTSEVYGTAQYVPIDERHPLVGQSPYSASKIGADQMALAFHASFATPVVTIRPFNTYGPRQSARAVIPTIIMQVAAGHTRIRLGSLSPTRDFSFVADTARGLICGIEAPASAVVGQTINLGSNFEISIGDSVAMIGAVMGVNIVIEQDGQRLRPQGSEVERLWSDNSLARERLGWVPHYAGLDGLRRGLSETAEWFGNPSHLNLYKADRYVV